ncbi:DNA-binding response OmpR family regulator [Clostridium acetobutylicum]|uniref:Stage 0 sporulation protein A homolog n=1 Tax=Clostridium acetobutylicum (strain ATCC 824 / DSM 792 / JCM 1419 / IAM 19013 / LMG 5710 / NBRC 13948 / NRRL B-527 / VKM B-1787 / 2291 / W) TaxID=272562 RepID=Q97FK2_CLOAB|nr:MULTISPECIES: response regulator transcription factor [Clostridium]AAK80681.1 Response regulator (CheY-like receiver domain and HTH-type DNA-binding) [Clostridium acetobutylicum ATCC 824]ADZ21781.1 Response regulator (CheY-like receiver domain and HTH-type DNA-binding) [Clostridium acetobutylicum EA 2018]AEI34536.1 response regulator [Clostridium acetobutylicum DSM 1731]AWV78905.1 DNA-binding response regulator [Clostridium acetobutylicum]MBC2395143.1 response regulator transcription factor
MDKILIVEDDAKINEMIQTLLIKNKYMAKAVFSGTEALLVLEKESFDLILLDLMLPGLSGEQVLTKINEQFQIPIICVSAKDDLDTKLGMIRDGADDYITKPFNNEELIVRIGAVLRRMNKGTSIDKTNRFTFKDLVLDSENHIVTINNEPIELTVKEYKILELLISNPKKVFTKQNIFESVWSEEYILDERVVTVHVSNLRNKLKHGDTYIKTVWGIGYKMQDN